MAMISGKRRTAREMAVQMLYQSDVGGSEPAQIFHAFDIGPYLAGEVDEPSEDKAPVKPSSEARATVAKRRHQLDEAFVYARRLVAGTLEHRQRIDDMITEQADNWRLERMPVVDRNVLRLAVYELLFELDIPKLVVVDEAIELAKRFGSENSSRFVNGLLDGLLRRHTFPGRMS